MSKRKYVFLSNWDRHKLKYACLFHNPYCKKVPTECEEIELTFNPYEDIETCMGARRYKRNSRGAMEQY